MRRPSRRDSVCGWKGGAAYFDVIVAGEVLRDAAWSYPEPTASFALLRGLIAFYAAPFEACFVDGQRVAPQGGRSAGIT